MLSFRVEPKVCGRVSGQRSQHADSCVHQKVTPFGGTYQATDYGLPFRKALFSLRQRHDVVRRFLKREELASGR